jgi:hypothetical protein
MLFQAFNFVFTVSGDPKRLQASAYFATIPSVLFSPDPPTENLEKAQKNQKRVGAAESDPKTTGPADNLREDAAEAVAEKEDSAEPA